MTQQTTLRVMAAQAPVSFDDIQIAAMHLRGLLRGLEQGGETRDQLDMEIRAAMIFAALPLAEKVAAYLSEVEEVKPQ